jgi:lantibiotic biosynthesis protein
MADTQAGREGFRGGYDQWMTDSKTWNPLLEGEAAEKVWKVIFEIADALVENEAESAWTPTLTGGTGGISLFFSYLAEARGDEAFADTAVRFYEQMVETAPGFPFLPGLYSGVAGVGWTVEHLAGRLFSPDDEEEDSNGPFDETLLELLREPWKGDYDLVSGLTGLGVYALERLPRRSALECLGGVLDRLADLAESGPEGTTWLSRPELLPDHQRELFPAGYHNLGMAHGVPGVIALLGMLSGIAPLRDRAVSLLQGAVSWLLARELPLGSVSRFADFAESSRPTRLAWCYGDAGIAAALLGAARHTDNPEWEREALRVALAAAKRDPESTGAVDTGLCHGTAGLGHVFNRLYQATGREELAGAARLWLERTLALRRQEGLAGFLTYAPYRGPGQEWYRDPDLLTGAAGIGLALLAAVSSLAPDWDRFLLVDLSRR